ncbi:MAG TPA: LysM peptidoglycan-binding domain-containing protein [Terriglobales bacterium]
MMKIAKAHLPIAIAMALAGLCGLIGCQSAQKPTAAVPAQASAPAIAQADPPKAADSAAQTAKAEPPVQPKTDPAADLIAQVEKEYQAGQDNYKNGHLEAAKENFDNAFNLMMSSSLDIRSDERLQREFDRVVDGVNGLELEALQEGDGFQEQQSEPAPIDEANDVTPPADPNVLAKAEAELKQTHSDLPLMMTDQVAGYISYFSGRGRGTLERALARSGLYRAMIQSTLKQEGVPQDLIYLAQAESGFRPLALSRAGARGIWQFMASRASSYGLERNWWVDDRQDPAKSTRAAAQHLRDLYNEFGDWYLAMAAYNSGPGTVQSAVKRTGYADFWELYRRNVLPKETRNYVPIILAVTIMAKNPSQYGLEDVVLDKPVPYDRVKIDYPVDLRLVAECVDSTAAELQEMNPSLLRMTTPKDQEFDLHLPAGTREHYLTSIEAIPPDMRVWWRYHKVMPGDTLNSLARTYHTTQQSIAQANALDADDQLRPDSKVIIPVAPGKHAPGEETAYSHHATPYKVRKGDTAETVADDFGVPAEMVRRWNHLKGNSLTGRHLLYVHLPVTPGMPEPTATASKAHSTTSHAKTAHTQAVAAKQTVHHKVQPGETLYSIATNYNTTVAALKETNRNVAVLRPGMILVVPSR